MSRVFLTAALLAIAPLCATAVDDTYVNSITVEMGDQPTISAINVLNTGQFFVHGLGNDYYFYDVLNYTNRNLFYTDYGFSFDTTPGSGGYPRMANNFVNSSLVTETNCSIYGDVEVNVFATNIVNRGLIEAKRSKITLIGQNIDLSRGNLRLSATTSQNLATLFDGYWGLSTNVSVNFSSNKVWSARPSFTSIISTNDVYRTNFTTINSTTNATNYVYVNSVDPQNTFTTVVFVNNSNPAVKVDAGFSGGLGFSFARPTVQLSNVVAIPGGGQLTNLLNLTDFLGNGFAFLNPKTFGTPAPTFQPANYSISTNSSLAGLSPANSVFSPILFNFPPSLTNFGIGSAADSTAYQIIMSPTSFNPASLPLGGYAANQSGRIEVLGNNVTMNDARIGALNYFLLRATNHFSSSNSLVDVPYSDISVTSSNGTLSLTNLLAPYVPRPVGTISLWSGRWTNIDVVNSITNYYHVFVVDSQIDPSFPSKVNSATLNAANTFLSDTMNVQSNLLLTAQRFTITSNKLAGVGGELNIQTPFISVANAFPNLQYFTNYGRFSTLGDSSFGVPVAMQSFVNRGGIDVQGFSVNTAIFENSGTPNNAILLTKSGGCSVQAAYAGLTNASLISSNGDVSIKSGVLYANGATIYSAHTLILDVPQRLDDSGFANNWECHDGFNFLSHPAVGDLFGTTLANVAFDNAQTISSSAIADRGPNPASFTNSATIGHLILDGGLNSQFVFTGNGNSKALYIDYLELKNNATVPGALFVDTNITLYVATASPIAPEKLNLIYPRIVWVPTFQGPNSTTTVLLRNGQPMTVNSSVPSSSTLDSDGDGVPNSIDPFPFDGLQVSAVTNANPQKVTISWYADSASWEYDIDYSTDLVAWTTLTSVFSGPSAGQLMTFQDSLSSGEHRYYRVRTLSH